MKPLFKLLYLVKLWYNCIMQFTDSTNNQGLYQHALFLTGANSSDFTLSDFTRLANFALDDYFSIVNRASGRIDLGDRNYTTFAIDKDNIVNGQADYALPRKLIGLEYVEILTSNDKWKVLDQVDPTDYQTQSYTKKYSEAGEPEAFDIQDGSIVLLPSPNYEKADGIRYHYTRQMEYFTTSDTSKEPGTLAVHDRFLSIHAAEAYATAKSLDNSNRLTRELEKVTLAVERDAFMLDRKKQKARARKANFV